MAAQTGTTVAVVRRLVGKVDREGERRERERVALEVENEGGSWTEKVARWEERTGTSGTTFWRALARAQGG